MSFPMAKLGDLVEPCVTWDPVSNPDHEFTYIDIASIDRVLKAVTSASPVIGRDAPSRARQIVRSSDVLVSTVRPNLNAVALVPESMDGATASTGFTVLRPSKELDPAYLLHWVKSSSFVDDMASKATGASYPAVSDRIVLESMIPFPNLTEQLRVAAILNKADALRSKRSGVIAKLDQLLKSVFFDMFGDPATNPKALEMVCLGDLGEWRSGGTPSRSDADNFEVAIPWYTSGELNDVYVHKSAEHISPNALRGSSAKLMAPGTLMVGMYDTAAFKSSISTMSSACNQAIAFSKLSSDKVETLYVYYLLQFGKEHYKRLQRGVRQKNLNLSMVRETRVLYPSMMQQQQFVRIAERVLKHKATLQAQAGQFDALFAALQQRAFTGTL